MKTYIERRTRTGGDTTVIFYNCTQCTLPLMSEEERQSGICKTCTEAPIELKVVEKKPLSLGRHENKVTRMKDASLQARIDAVVEKAKHADSNVQHDVVRHINHPLRLRGNRSLGGK